MREYSKEYAMDFLNKSKRFLEVAKNASNDYPEEAAFNAIQAVINANDAYTIGILGKRASRDHREAIILHKEASMKTGESKLDILHMELDARDVAGYDVKKQFRKGGSAMIIKKAERFIDWVENKLKHSN